MGCCASKVQPVKSEPSNFLYFKETDMNNYNEIIPCANENSYDSEESENSENSNNKNDINKSKSQNQKNSDRKLDNQDSSEKSDIIINVSTSDSDFGENEAQIDSICGYKFISQLGSGSFAQVYEMEKDHIHYAVKVCDLNKKQLSFLNKTNFDPKQEAAIMKKFDHPYITKIYDLIEEVENHQICIVMELLTGGTILDCPDLHSKKVAFAQTLLGLQYIHFQRIAHRDLKVENILRHKDGTIRISDFGISIFVPEGTSKISSDNSFTPLYSAPEAITESEYDPFIGDIYSLGIVLYKLILGTIPYEGVKNIFELQNLRQSKPITFPDDIDQNLKTLIQQMTEINPNDRISLEQIWENEWMKDVVKYKKIKRDEPQEKIYKTITPDDTIKSVTRLVHSNTLIAIHRLATVISSHKLTISAEH